MENEPDKWEVQTWMLPGAWGLVRRETKWFFEGMQGAIKIQIDTWIGEHLAMAISDYQTRVEQKYRRSFSFRWMRFWYLRKHNKKRE